MMKNIYIPPTPGEYREVLDAAMPDPAIREHPFYKGMADWVTDHRTPILYDQSDPSEYTNFSIAFNWLLRRNYDDTTLGPPNTIQTMYTVHELTHMTAAFPSQLDQTNSTAFADTFIDSEYRASNETEILIHYRVPEFRKVVFQGIKIVFDVMREHAIPQPSAGALLRLRTAAIEGDCLDNYFSDSQENRAILDRLKSFNGNRPWAEKQYASWLPYFSNNTFETEPHLDTSSYEARLHTYTSSLTQEQYEANIIRNVRYGYALCGLAVPHIVNFKHATDLAADLEHQHAITQS